MTVALPSVEVTRLQSDSAVIADQATVPAGSYTAIAVTVGPTTSSTNNVFINTSGSTITSGTTPCLNGAVCTLPIGAIATITVPLSLNLSDNQSQWVGLDFNLNKAITSSGNTISVDFTQSGVMTATTAPSTGIPSGSVDTFEDFVGVVTAVSGTSITVKSGITGASLMAGITSSTEIDVAPSSYSGTCPGQGIACVTPGSTVSMDTLVNSAGTFTATEIDVLDATQVDEVEGIVYSVGNGSVGIVLTDKVSASGDPILGATTTTYGSGMILDVSTLNPTFSVDTKTLSIPLPAPTGFSGLGDLFAGQVIRAQVTGVVLGNSSITANAKEVLLRYSRLSGTVNSVSGNNFTISGLPTYLNVLNSNLGATPSVATFPNNTIFDGVTGTSGSNFNGAAVSIRALYLNPTKTSLPFPAAKVRVP